jgi:hypothetical protein
VGVRLRFVEEAEERRELLAAAGVCGRGRRKGESKEQKRTNVH